MKNILYFAGQSNAQHRVVVTAMPAIPIAEERGEWEVVPGRAGEIYLPSGDTVYESVDIRIPLWAPPNADLTAIGEWLHGSGQLRMQGSPWFWHARVYGGVAFVPASYDDGWSAAVTFRCQPFRYHYPETGEIVLTAAGTVNNPGTALSLPRIKVEAAGDFMLMIGGELIEVTGGSIIIDSDLYDCYSADGALLANSRVRLDEYPVLLPGPNAVSWSGAVSSVAIIPRWRDV